MPVIGAKKYVFESSNISVQDRVVITISITNLLCCSIFRLMRANVVANAGDWTNNNAESINHVLKSVVHWRPQFLTDLIAELKQLVQVCALN